MNITPKYQVNYSYITIFYKTKLTAVQITIPVKRGIKKETTVHFKLPVSFFIVKTVVAHGK